MSGKGDINAQIAEFEVRLLRRDLAGPKNVALATCRLLSRFVSSRRWTNPEEVISQVRALARRLEAAQPHEFACSNICRRVLKILRTGDELTGSDEGAREPQASSMFGLLLPSARAEDGGARRSRDLRHAVLEEISALMDEVSNDDPLYRAGVELISPGDVILVACPESATLSECLFRAAQRCRFSLLLTQGLPNTSASVLEAFVQRMKHAGVATSLIPDASVYAHMSRVSKVLISASAVFANGGCLSAGGVSLTCQAAKAFSKPVLAVAGSYKLSAFYPFDAQTLVEVGNSANVVDFSNARLMQGLDVVNPVNEYVPPEYITILTTTDGDFAPDFLYRIVLDNYSSLDFDLADKAVEASSGPPVLGSLQC